MQNRNKTKLKEKKNEEGSVSFKGEPVPKISTTRFLRLIESSELLSNGVGSLVSWSLWLIKLGRT